jgi:hypothetical protein
MSRDGFGQGGKETKGRTNNTSTSPTASTLARDPIETGSGRIRRGRGEEDTKKEAKEAKEANEGPPREAQLRATVGHGGEEQG